MASSLLACSGAEPTAPVAGPVDDDSASEAPAGQQLVGTFTLDVDAEGNAKVTMVDTRLATSVSVGATANKVNLITLSRGACGPGLYCTNMRLQNLFAAHDIRGATVVLSKVSNIPGASAANSHSMPSHLAGTTAVPGIGVWVFGNLEEAGAAGDRADLTWAFNWTSGTISVAGKVFADVRASNATVETSCADGLDNDGDANFDCNDGDCATDAACPAEWCGTNGRDEDWDGTADCADDDCDGHSKCVELVCDDGADSDGDGAYDCADSDCADAENCAPPVVTDPQCAEPYNVFADGGRHVLNYVGDWNPAATCDNPGYVSADWVGPAWYRFTGAAGTQMPTSPPRLHSCGTHAPVWMNGTHPAVEDGVVDRQACLSWGGDTCVQGWGLPPLRVVNCGDFYLYYLQNTSSCHLRYCGENPPE